MGAPEPAFSLDGHPVLEFQPVVDLSDGRLLGMEALVRWVLSSGERIGPDRLLPLAEANGDIGPLHEWVMVEACTHAQLWSPSVQLAVNCTLSQLRRASAAKAVLSALEQTGLPPDRLTLEISEDSAADAEATADLRGLSAKGVQLAVDDVGTNWSSFEPLKRLAVNTVKIDGSFVRGLEPSQGINRMVVETVIHMAHSLGMSTIAEGVETAAQVALVREFDADAAQGYFFARPMSAEEADRIAAGPVTPRYSRTEATTTVPPAGAATTAEPAATDRADAAEAEAVDPSAGTDQDDADQDTRDAGPEEASTPGPAPVPEVDPAQARARPAAKKSAKETARKAAAPAKATPAKASPAKASPAKSTPAKAAPAPRKVPSAPVKAAGTKKSSSSRRGGSSASAK